jgi:GNAT superfamily N-acetyltransferase
MQSNSQWRIRPATAADRAFLEAISERLTIGMAPWRDRDIMLATMRGFLLDDLNEMGEEKAVFIAVGADDAPAGVATVAVSKNFTGEAQAYLGELAVRAEVEGQGVASALLARVEEWAREHTLPFVVLDTGSLNTRARAFYARHGYGDESVRLVKPLM